MIFMNISFCMPDFQAAAPGCDPFLASSVISVKVIEIYVMELCFEWLGKSLDYSSY